MQDEPQDELPEQPAPQKQQPPKVRDIRRKDGNQAQQQHSPELKALGKALELGDRLEEILEGVNNNRDALAAMAKALHDGEQRRDDKLSQVLAAIMDEHEYLMTAFRKVAANPKDAERLRKSAVELTGSGSSLGRARGGLGWFLLFTVTSVVVCGVLILVC